MKKPLNVSDYLDVTRIVDLQAVDKDDALEELLDVICQSEKISDKKLFRKAIFEREKLMSTGIGYGIAIPHARDASIADFVIALGRKREGIEYESIDNKPVQLIFMIGASDQQDKDYIRLLSRLVLRLKNPEFVQELLQAQTQQELFELIQQS